MPRTTNGSRSRSNSRGRKRSKSGARKSAQKLTVRTYSAPGTKRSTRSSSPRRTHSAPREDVENAQVPRDLYVVQPEDHFQDEHGYRNTDRLHQGDDFTNPDDHKIHPLSPKHRKNLLRWYRKRVPNFTMTRSRSDNTGSFASKTQDSNSHKELSQDHTFQQLEDPEDDYIRTKQQVAILSIVLVASQLLILIVQLTLCGMAPLEVNGFIGPYPSTFSEWGGKNAYIMLNDNEWWRLVSPSFLNIGVLHLLVNAFCHLESVALYEREWGSFRWLIIYLMSSLGCQCFSNLFDEDTVAVGSSGALMGMFGGKLAQVVTLSIFELSTVKYDDVVRIDQLSSTLCGMTLIFVLSAFAYIDWSGHMGGFLCGFLSGIVLLSNSVESCCSWFFWVTFGLLGLVSSLSGIMYLIITKLEPDEELADVCEYFRSFFPEDYDCQCLWE